MAQTYNPDWLSDLNKSADAAPSMRPAGPSSKKVASLDEGYAAAGLAQMSIADLIAMARQSNDVRDAAQALAMAGASPEIIGEMLVLKGVSPDRISEIASEALGAKEAAGAGLSEPEASPVLAAAALAAAKSPEMFSGPYQFGAASEDEPRRSLGGPIGSLVEELEEDARGGFYSFLNDADDFFSNAFEQPFYEMLYDQAWLDLGEMMGGYNEEAIQNAYGYFADGKTWQQAEQDGLVPEGSAQAAIDAEAQATQTAKEKSAPGAASLQAALASSMDPAQAQTLAQDFGHDAELLAQASKLRELADESDDPAFGEALRGKARMNAHAAFLNMSEKTASMTPEQRKAAFAMVSEASGTGPETPEVPALDEIQFSDMLGQWRQARADEPAAPSMDSQNSAPKPMS